MNKHQSANIMKQVSRYGLLFIGLLTFTFSLFSGAEGDSVMAVLKNSPNTLPWLILFGLTLLSFKKELTGSLAIVVFGITLFFFFNTGPNFFISTFILTLIIPTLGLLMLMSWFLERKESAKPE